MVCGEARFEKYSRSSHTELDSANAMKLEDKRLKDGLRHAATTTFS
jgi:hypothetical protein